MEIKVTEELLEALANTIWMAGKYLESTNEEAMEVMNLVEAKATVSHLFSHLVGSWEKRTGKDYLEGQLLLIKVAALWPGKKEKQAEVSES